MIESWPAITYIWAKRPHPLIRFGGIGLDSGWHAAARWRVAFSWDLEFVRLRQVWGKAGGSGREDTEPWRPPSLAPQSAASPPLRLKTRGTTRWPRRANLTSREEVNILPVRGGAEHPDLGMLMASARRLCFDGA